MTNMTMTQADLLLAQMRLNGLSIDDLIRHAAVADETASGPVPTVAQWVEEALQTLKPGTRRTYATHCHTIAKEYGDRPLNTVKTTDLQSFQIAVAGNHLRRSNSIGGRSAEESFVAAARWLFGAAVGTHLVTNPAAALVKPTRRENTRRALKPRELAELDRVTRSGGRDPQLDALIVRTILETGARRGGLLALTVYDLDDVYQRIRLWEKGNTLRWQPVSRTLLDALHELAASRGATRPRDKVLRYLPRPGEEAGEPLTRRHFDSMTNRWHRNLPWAEREGVSPHWLRHTAITNVERVAGFPVAKKFAGHQHAKGSEVTITYLKAGEDDVAAAVSWITGEPHPLAPTAEDYRPDLEYLAPGQKSSVAAMDWPEG